MSGTANYLPQRAMIRTGRANPWVVGKPLHPTLPVCRIPMKKSKAQAPYQSILSFPHISTDRSKNSNPDRWEEIIKSCILKAVFYAPTVARRCEKVAFTEDALKKTLNSQTGHTSIPWRHRQKKNPAPFFFL